MIKEIVLEPMSESAFDEMQNIYKDVLVDYPHTLITDYDRKWLSMTYEEYLKEEKVKVITR